MLFFCLIMFLSCPWSSFVVLNFRNLICFIYCKSRGNIITKCTDCYVRPENKSPVYTDKWLLNKASSPDRLHFSHLQANHRGNQILHRPITTCHQSYSSWTQNNSLWLAPFLMRESVSRSYLPWLNTRNNVITQTREADIHLVFFTENKMMFTQPLPPSRFLSSFESPSPPNPW